MATVTVNSQANPVQKPTRSLTHPLRDLKDGSTRQRKKQSEQVDPDELRRRLEAHVAEQEKRAAKKRSRAIAKKEKESVYHHVPKVAAAAFERTTTPVHLGEKEVQKNAIHKLGRAALKQYVEENAHTTTASFSLRETLALDQARRRRDLIGDRNQFQRTRQLEEAARLDVQRNPSKLPQRTFATDKLDIPQVTQCSRPLSIGDINWGEDLETNDSGSHIPPKARALVQPDRQDWEQCDQVPAEVHRSVKERVSPFLRKTDSMWILKSRKGQKPEIVPEMCYSAPTSDTKQKKTFFGLFKR